MYEHSLGKSRALRKLQASEINFFPAAIKGGCCREYCDGYSRQEDEGQDAAIPPWRRGTVVGKARMRSPGRVRSSKDEWNSDFKDRKSVV